MTSKDIRTNFLEFFRGKDHKIVPSAPMVIKNDPSLMFTNAGMNQFKEFFLGHSKATDKRVADTQKCLRVSGKHNDLEEVGKDTYHHTMFEMMGNWSFGDYFKKEAINWAWEFLTDVCKIEKDRLYVSVFEGSEDADQLEMDTESYDYWKDILSEDRIIKGNKKDNFWEMGDQGPCGPSSEIHVDIRSDSERKKVDGASLVNQDHPQVVEIWNLVFIQYNRKSNGQLEQLPEKHVDTGMGFERLCMVLQGVQSNYDTDLFRPIIKEIETITNTTYGKDEETDIAIRVIADHLRAVSFSIADGQLPSNTGAGYVIRRILRRAVRYGFTFLGTREPFIHHLVNELYNTMDAFPELREQYQLIENVIREEEQSFLKTLDQGLGLLDEVVSRSKDKKIDGEKAFELYDTYGFPFDLTSLILEEKGYSIDKAGFEEAMKKQKARSKAASEVAREDWQVMKKNGQTEFIGYDCLEADVQILKYRKISSAKEGEQFQLVLNHTPFYAEGGGQVGDKGYLKSDNGDVVYVIDTRKENNEILHITKNLPRNMEAGLRAVVDGKQRQRTARNHTATHLLHQALRDVLGNHVEQKGSAVHSKYLRFDFSHFAKLSDEELKAVEDFVNARIEEQLPLQEDRSTSMEEALKQGAMALFGEKYGDQVRTVRFGQSIELCGGTHVPNTSDLWHFKITGESAIAAGIRRIEAITSDAVKAYFLEGERAFREIMGMFRGQGNPVKAIQALQKEFSALKKEVEQLQKEKAKGLKTELKNELVEENGILFLAKQVDLDAGGMKDLSFELGNELENLFLVLGAENDGKALLSCYISKTLVEKNDWNAGTIVRELGKLIKGGGGGQPFFATAGGKDPSGIPKALGEVKKYLS